MATMVSLYDLYFQHFSLREAPFSISPNPRYLYLSQQHKEAFAHLLYGIGTNGGFTVLTGEVGTGKTTLCRALLEDPPEGVDIALIFNPCLDSLELLAAICDELGVEYPQGTHSIKVLNDQLNRYLLDAHAKGRRPIVLIDEAQNLRLEVLEQIRLLTNLETDHSKLIQIILVGQPELNTLLAREELRQLAQRITARYHLEPLSLAETGAYIAHRLSVAGAGGKVFTPAAIRAIYQRSRGIPRVINLISDRALLGAYSKHQLNVNATTVRKAAMELLFSRASFLARGRTIQRLGWIFLALFLVLVFSQGDMVSPWISVLTAVPGLTLPKENEVPPPAIKTGPPQVSDKGFSPSSLVDLDSWLMGAEFSKAQALSHLKSLWGLGDEAMIRGCESLPAEGVQCSEYKDSWVGLIRINHPVVLQLQRPDGRVAFATLVSIQGSTASLSGRDGIVLVDADQLSHRWMGEALILWRSSLDRRFRPLKQGAVSPVIPWVRQKLKVPEGEKGKDYFDAALKQAVMEFQRQRGIHPDGRIGDWTMANLESLDPEENIPRLDRSR
jgi:general secretion pathway protein A